MKRLLAAVLVIVAGFNVWWNWPRGDARLVGKWRWYQGRDPVAVMELQANGMGYFLHPNGPRTPIGWNLSGDDFAVTNPRPAWLWWLAANLGVKFPAYQYHSGVYRLKSAAKNEIVLDDPSESGKLRTVVFVRWKPMDGPVNE